MRVIGFVVQDSTNSSQSEATASPETSAAGNPDASPAQVRPRSATFWLFAATVICALGTAIYSNTWNNPFIFDDKPNIVNNKAIRVTSLDAAELLKATVFSPNRDRPVAHLSFALNYYFGGYNVFGYHLVNLVIHLANGLLVYLLADFTLRRLGQLSPPQQPRFAERHIPWVALLAGCIFVAHPLQTQGVTYIVQRMASLATFFYLLSLWLYILGRLAQTSARRWGLWVGCFISFILALTTKQMTATLPVVVLMYEWFFFQKAGPRWSWQHFWYAVLAIALLALAGNLYLDENPLNRILAGYEHRDFTLTERLLTQPRVVLLYISLMLFPDPARLNLLHHVSTSQSLVNPPTTLVAILVLVGVLSWAVYLTRRHRLVSFCILWFFGNLAIESSIIPLEMVFEHRVYLPMFGFSLLLPYLVWSMCSRSPQWAAAICTVLIVLYAAGTYERNKVWRSPVTVWSDVLEKNPTEARAYTNRGKAYREVGEIDNAMRDYNSAIELDHERASAYYNRGNLHAALGHHVQAIRDYTKAIELKPHRVQAFNNRANVYIELGKYELALKDQARALEIDPTRANVYENRGRLYALLEKHGLALADYTKSIELDPHNASTYRNRAKVYTSMEEYELAIQDCSKSLDLEPDNVSPLEHRGRIYMVTGEYREALRDFRKLIEMKPNRPDAYNNIAWILAVCPDDRIRDGRQAVAYAERARALVGWSDYLICGTLAAAYAEAGDFAQAVNWQSKALQQAPTDQQEEQRARLDLYYNKKAYRLAPQP